MQSSQSTSFFKSFLWTLPFIGFITGYFVLDRIFRSEDLETPSLIGLTTHQAVAELASKNLNLRFLAFKEDPLLETNTIISQSPIAGQKIKENQSVYVVAVKKPAQLLTPNYIGKTKEEIQADATAHKITIKYHHLPSCYPQNSCFAQYPAPEQALNNKMIVYIAASQNKPCIMPDFKGKQLTQITDFLTTQSITFETFHYPPMPEHECNCIVTDQRPMAGSIIHQNPDKPLHVQLQVKTQ